MKLWGIDHTLDGDARFFLCLPVLEDGGAFVLVRSFQWAADRGVVRITDEGEIRDISEPLALGEDVEVPAGNVVLVMGPRFGEDLVLLGVELEAAWRPVQGGFRIAVLGREDANELRGTCARRAKDVLDAELRQAFGMKELLGLCGGLVPQLSRQGQAAHEVVMNTSYLDRLEVALLDLLVSKLLPDGGERYASLLLFYATRLRMEVAVLSQQVEARAKHYVWEWCGVQPERALAPPDEPGRRHPPTVPPKPGAPTKALSLKRPEREGVPQTTDAPWK